MKRIFKRKLSGTWNEIRIIEDKTGEFEHYFQDKEIGFTFSQYKNNVANMGYKSAKDCISTLKEKGMLGVEVNYDKQMESERAGKAAMLKERERIKNNPAEYRQRVAALGM